MDAHQLSPEIQQAARELAEHIFSGESVAPPPAVDVEPLIPTWIQSNWRDYYVQANDGFNVWAYFQQMCDYIPTQSMDKNRYTIELANLLSKEAVCIARKDIISKEGRQLLNDAFYLYKNCLINLYYREDNSNYRVNFYHHPGLTPPFAAFKPFIVKKAENHISVLLQNKYDGFYSEPCDMQVPKEMDLALNYGDVFVKKHELILSKLQAGGASLFLLTGKPGTGKTTYIKYLSSLVKREFIYIPVGMVSSLSSPEMLSFLISKKGCILVLEDAEKAVRTREDNESADVVSILLNMSDGILGNVLNVSIIATYNAERETVDKAFLRKGRLKFEHEFKALTLDETNRLLEHLKLPTSDTPLTLAEVYNLGDDNGHVEKVKRSMGFLASP